MQEKVYFKNLDAIRFIAASMVFLTHRMDKLYIVSGLNVPFLGRVWDLISSGYLGVSMFFVLSGFLITYILLEEKKLTSRINIKNFYVRRILRIWPLYFLIILISFGIIPVAYHLTELINTTPQRLPYYLAFLSNFEVYHLDRYHLGPGNFPVVFMQIITWSVSVEEQFYVFWPLLFFVVKQRYHIFIFVFAIIGSVLFRLHHRDDHMILPYHTLSNIVYLAIGGLSAYLVITYSTFRNLFSRMPVWASFLMYLSGITILLFRYDLVALSPFMRALIPLFYASFFAFILLDQIYSTESFLKIGRFKSFTFWGRYSYGIYLLHPVVMGLMDFAIIHYGIVETTFINYLVTGLISLILTLGISYLLYEFFEKKFLALKGKFSVIVKE